MYGSPLIDYKIFWSKTGSNDFALFKEFHTETTLTITEFTVLTNIESVELD